MLVASYTSSEQSRVSRLFASMVEISHVMNCCSSYAMTILLIASTVGMTILLFASTIR